MADTRYEPMAYGMSIRELVGQVEDPPGLRGRWKIYNRPVVLNMTGKR